MKKKKSKKRTRNLPASPAKAKKSPVAVETAAALSQEDERFNDDELDAPEDIYESDDEGRWIAVVPPDPWYNPHFWAISVEDPSAVRMRETMIAAKVLLCLAPVALLAAFAPLSRVSRVGCVFVAAVFCAVGIVASVFGKRALEAREKEEFDDADRLAKIAKRGLVVLHAALIVVALLGVMAGAWCAFVALGNSALDSAVRNIVE